MRKVIILILFTFLLVPLYKVKAINTFDLPINQNISINKVTEKYKWYKIKEVDSRDENVFEHICEYLEFKETDYSSWSTEKPESKYGRIIEEKEESSGEAEEYYFLMIDNILASNLRTYEIKLYDDNKQVNYYSIICYNCSSTYPKENLFDNDYNTFFEIKFNQPITLALTEKTSNNIRVQFIYDKEDYLFGYRITKLDKYFNVIESREENTSTLVNRSSDSYSSYINSRSSNWSTSTKYYRYKDAYLVCGEKEYLDDYYEEVDDYIKDENRSIKMYDYENVNVEPEVIEKEVFKEILVPKEKIVYRYLETNNSNDSCEYVSSQSIESSDDKEEIKSSIQLLENSDNDKKITKRDIKFYVIFSIILLLIIFLCLFIKELINKCRQNY